VYSSKYFFVQQRLVLKKENGAKENKLSNAGCIKKDLVAHLKSQNLQNQ